VEDEKSMSDLSLVVPNFRTKRAKSDESNMSTKAASTIKPASPEAAGGGGGWSFFTNRS